MPWAQVARSTRCIMHACTAAEATTLPLPPALPLPLLLTAAEATTLPLPPALPLPLLLQLLLIPRAPGSSGYERTVHWGVLEHSPRARCGVESGGWWRLAVIGGGWRWLVVVGWVGLLLS